MEASPGPNAGQAIGERAEGMSPEHVREARIRLNWSVDQLAEASGLSFRTVADFEAGRRSPRIRTVLALRRAFARAAAPPD